MAVSVDHLNALIEPLFPGLMGVHITEATAEKIVATLPVRPELCTAGGMLHGGAYMAFADTLGAIGTIVNLPEGARTTTIESKTNFFGAARSGTEIVGESTPLHRGKTTMVWQTRILDTAGKLLAMVVQTQMVLPVVTPGQGR
jgi:1,4-dihydroxy-2-naphthoyl-CoA hydrolase